MGVGGRILFLGYKRHIRTNYKGKISSMNQIIYIYIVAWYHGAMD